MSDEITRYDMSDILDRLRGYADSRLYALPGQYVCDVSEILNEHAALVTRLTTSERERDEARREREDYKAMYLDLWDAAKRHETEREALRHRAERAERVVKALREPSDAVIDALRTHIYQYALTNSLDMAHGLRAAVEAADCATPTPEPTP